MSDTPESFLRRWSRLKREGEAAQPEPVGRDDEEPPPLPPIEELGPDSDYSAFLHPKVDPQLRRAALKRLFSSERFKAMDGLDVYVGDYSKPEPLAAGVAVLLRHACAALALDREAQSSAGAGRPEAHAPEQPLRGDETDPASPTDKDPRAL
ncbi:MAG TPA: DUF3306 domain-containing protein [Burkholderiales bacterium]|jgi:hypothetical protein|nr:DUF3306 domain-containing protein [Burkholderiales bacterium]